MRFFVMFVTAVCVLFLEKEILKIDRRIVPILSNMQNVVISRCCFATFCKQRHRNEQRIITHAYTAIVLVAVAVEVCLI